MHVKVDYSEDCKSHNLDTSRPGTYAIYTRKHWWDKWTEGNTFADLEYCKRCAKNMAQLPINYK